jgi:hypothetical protein
LEKRFETTSRKKPPFGRAALFRNEWALFARFARGLRRRFAGGFFVSGFSLRFGVSHLALHKRAGEFQPPANNYTV